MINRDDISKLAELARIGITEDEKTKLGVEVSNILGYIDQIKKADLNMKAEDRVGALKNVFREDEVLNTSGADTDILLKEAPHSEKGYVSVKKILGSSE